jgi:hypothetical protein
MGEALAAKLAMSLTFSLNIKRFIIEGDFQIVILAQYSSRLTNLLYYA